MLEQFLDGICNAAPRYLGGTYRNVRIKQYADIQRRKAIFVIEADYEGHPETAVVECEAGLALLTPYKAMDSIGAAIVDRLREMGLSHRPALAYVKA